MVAIEIPKTEIKSVGNLIKRIKRIKSNPGPLIKQIKEEQLFLTISENNLEKLKLHLENGVDVNAVYGEFKSTLLSSAAFYGDLEIVKFLLEKKANVKMFDELGNTALHSVCYGNTEQHLLIAKKLLGYGADVNASCGYQDNETSLMIAAHYGNLEMVKLLVNAGADIYKWNGYSQTAHFCAKSQGHGHVAYYLLSLDSTEKKVTKIYY